MDIKDIALKVADSLRNKIDGISHMQSNQGLVRFAEALIAEIAKQNEPICQFRPDSDNWIDCRKQFFEMWLGEKRIVYALPPTAEQIANETAWQPIETAPKDEAVFLAWRKHATHPLMVRYEPSYDWFANYDGEHVYDLTHWMPLPTPPKRNMEGV